MVEPIDGSSARIRLAVAADASDIARIYNQGIADGGSTFEIEPRTAEERAGWLAAHGDRWPVLVADAGAAIVGWAAVGPYSDRSCYRGIGEASVYVDREHRCSSLGRRLLDELIAAASARGYWKLIGRSLTGTRPVSHCASGAGFGSSARTRGTRR